MDNGLSVEKASLIGMITGDGCLYKSQLLYVNNNLTLVKKFARLVKKVYGANTRQTRCKSNAFMSRIVRKSIAEDLKEYCRSFKSCDWEVPKQIFASAKVAKAAYVRALFDDDGTIGKREIRLISINERALNQLRVLLHEMFNIHSYVYPRCDGGGYHLSIYGKENMKRFANAISFSSGLKRKKLRSLLDTYNWLWKGWQKQPTVELILQELAGGPVSTSKLMCKVERRNQTVWTHLQKLEKKGMVVRIGTTKRGSIVWCLRSYQNNHGLVHC